MFFFFFVALQSSFILSDSSTVFPYLRSLRQKDLIVYLYVCVCVLEISYRCFLSTLDMGGGGELPVKSWEGVITEKD